MNYATAINFAFLLINAGLDFVKKIKAESGMSDEELAAYADNSDLTNKDDIKKLIAQ